MTISHTQMFGNHGNHGRDCSIANAISRVKVVKELYDACPLTDYYTRSIKIECTSGQKNRVQIRL